MSGQFVLKGNTVDAQYKEEQISGYKHNPYIEALPEIYEIEKVASRISRKPSYDPKERFLPDSHRIHAVWSLSDYVKPLPRHIALESSISICLRQGYKARNPIKAEWKHQMREAFENLDWTSDEYEPLIRSTATGFAIMGLSGVGKSTAIESVLGLYPQVIKHKEYNGEVFPQDQVVWLKLDCPYNGSIKGLCLDFFDKLDKTIETNYYKKFSNSRINIDNLILEMGHVAAINGLGVLVIDEIQRLNEAKSGGAKAMMNIFVKLINNIGLPVVLMGTPGSLGLFDDLATARRNEGFGTELWLNYPKNDIWDSFIKSIWKYQYTELESPLTPAIEKAIYDFSQGIPDFAIKLYMLTQWKVIGTGKEKITVSIIRSVANECFRLAKPILDAIKNNNESMLRKIKDIPTADMQKHYQESLQKSGIKNASKINSHEDVEETPIFKIARLLIQAGIEDVNLAKECAELAVSKMRSKDDFKEAVRLAMHEAWSMQDGLEDPKKVESGNKKQNTNSKHKVSQKEIQKTLSNDKKEGKDLLKA